MAAASSHQNVYLILATLLQGENEWRKHIDTFVADYYLRRSRQVLERLELLGWGGDEIGIPPPREIRTGGKKGNRNLLQSLSSVYLSNMNLVRGGIPGSTIFFSSGEGFFLEILIQAAGH